MTEHLRQQLKAKQEEKHEIEKQLFAIIGEIAEIKEKILQEEDKSEPQ